MHQGQTRLSAPFSSTNYACSCAKIILFQGLLIIFLCISQVMDRDITARVSITQVVENVIQ